MFNIININLRQIKTIMTYHLTIVRMAIIKKKKTNASMEVEK
jgi:hypothetical protein